MSLEDLLLWLQLASSTNKRCDSVIDRMMRQKESVFSPLGHINMLHYMVQRTSKMKLSLWAFRQRFYLRLSECTQYNYIGPQVWKRMA
jgi:hypothetical protein